MRFAGVDGTLMHYALGQIRPGDVLIVDRCGDTRHAAVGGGVAFGFIRRRARVLAPARPPLTSEEEARLHELTRG